MMRQARNYGIDLRWLVVALIVGAPAAVSFPAPGLAQAGSTGGTVGKTDKSLSGSEPVEPEPQPKKEKPPPRPAKSRDATTESGAKQRQASCTRLSGVWSAAMGGQIIFGSGGSVSHTLTHNKGTWSCSKGQFTVTWKSGTVDRCSLSSDGMTQTCTNSIGGSFTRTRLSKR